ncbi:MAG TPA: deoxyribose-phosphate aldolase [Syntrophomonadaceae bacterium]|nr:deoxyribose-phosphate aldolase [Syntrophomonadaceae bacterium]
MLASYLDSTNLKADARTVDIQSLCDEAKRWKMAAVCINPGRVALASRCLEGTAVQVCTVIGFPLGAGLATVKVQEASQALDAGASELDMVINIGAVKDGDYSLVEREILALQVLKQDFPFILKVIVETALINKEQLARLTELVGLSGADYIKTSTGFASRGASLEDLEIIKGHLRPGLKIKASGGIRDLNWALQLISAGAHRIGSSSAGLLMEKYTAGEKD